MVWENPSSHLLKGSQSCGPALSRLRRRRRHVEALDTVAVEMGWVKDKSVVFRRKSNLSRNGSRAPLLEKNNNRSSITQADDNQDVSGHDNPLDQNSFSIHTAHPQPHEEVTLQGLAELLGVPPGAGCDASDDELGCSVSPETISGQQQPKPGAVRLIRKSVSRHFPKPPADVDQNLRQHLWDVQSAVFGELMRLGPALEPMGLMGCLINCYHCHTFGHLDRLLQNIGSLKNSFALMIWGLKTYLSQELLGHPDLREVEPMQHVDLLVLSEWAVRAKDKLLENTQKEIRGHLEKILLHDREQNGCDRDEAYVSLYVDTIGCIAAIPSTAQPISPKLSDKLREVCFQELQIFVRRYRDEQTKALEKTAKADKPEMMHFFKTLKTCQELKKYVRTQGKGDRSSLCIEIVKTLENMEAFILKLLRDIVTNMAKIHLEKYFSAENKQFFLLIDAVGTIFPPLENSQDVRQTVMDQVYGIVVHSYMEHLIKVKRQKLEKCRSLNVGQIVSQDADLLHAKMSELVPGVKKWNYKLKKVQEVLDCNDLDALKLTVAQMQEQSLQTSEDQQLLDDLLRWKGLSKWDVREVLDAVSDDSRPGPMSRACCSVL